jgi:hypothetical protein
MKKYKILTTFIICFFWTLNFAFSISNISNLEQLSNIEFESESENEPEGKDKSKLDYLGETFDSNLKLKGLLRFNFFAKNLFCQNFICEVPTSPPNNC